MVSSSTCECGFAIPQKLDVTILKCLEGFFFKVTQIERTVLKKDKVGELFATVSAK